MHSQLKGISTKSGATHSHMTKLLSSRRTPRDAHRDAPSNLRRPGFNPFQHRAAQDQEPLPFDPPQAGHRSLRDSLVLIDHTPKMPNAGIAERLADACRLVSYELRRVKNCRESTYPTDGRIHGELVSQQARANASKKS